MRIGENFIVKVNLFQADGTTPLLLSSADLITANILQFSRQKASYTFGTDPEIRQGDSTSQLEVEVTKEVSNKLRDGDVIMELIIEVPDAEFEVDTNQRDEALIRIAIVKDSEITVT